MNDSIPSLHVIYIPSNSILATNRASLLLLESKRGFGHRSRVQQGHQAPLQHANTTWTTTFMYQQQRLYFRLTSIWKPYPEKAMMLFYVFSVSRWIDLSYSPLRWISNRSTNPTNRSRQIDWLRVWPMTAKRKSIDSTSAGTNWKREGSVRCGMSGD
jgi:hypothetical protein